MREAKYQIPKKSDVNPSIALLIAMCFEKDPNKRPSINSFMDYLSFVKESLSFRNPEAEPDQQNGQRKKTNTSSGWKVLS